MAKVVKIETTLQAARNEIETATHRAIMSVKWSDGSGSTEVAVAEGDEGQEELVEFVREHVRKMDLTDGKMQVKYQKLEHSTQGMDFFG